MQSEGEKSKQVLVIEDEEAIGVFVKIVLERDGFEVTVVNNGQEALDFVASSSLPPDLLFLDMKMPVMDGKSFLTEYRQRYPGYTAHIVVMTAADDAHKRADDLGVEGCLAKPFGMQELLSTARKHVIH
jgi:DNA-binding response OmpR family regulator